MNTVTENGTTTELKEKPCLMASIVVMRDCDIPIEDFEAELRERVSPMGVVKVLRAFPVTFWIK